MSPLNHPEEKLTEKFLEWFTETSDYLPLFDDVDTSGGDPVDSAGFAADKLLLIEFKNKVSLSSVEYVEGIRAGIELKIQRVLRDLYGPSKGRVAQSLGEWFSGFEPTFILVANSYSDNALKSLGMLLCARCRQWKFGYQVLLWNGKSAEVLLEKASGVTTKQDLAAVEFPEMPYPKAKRKPSMLPVNLLEYADGRKMEVLEHLLQKLKDKGCVLKPGPAGNVVYHYPIANKFKGNGRIAIYPYEFDKCEGIVVGATAPNVKALELVNQAFAGQWPGREGPRVGFMHVQRVLRTEADVEVFLQPISLFV